MTWMVLDVAAYFILGFGTMVAVENRLPDELYSATDRRLAKAFCFLAWWAVLAMFAAWRTVRIFGGFRGR